MKNINDWDIDIIGCLKIAITAGICYWIFGPIGLGCYALYRLSKMSKSDKD